jgi:hypothetical protein
MLTARDVECHFERDNGDISLNSLNSQSLPTFPVIQEDAFHGLAGEIVKAIEPYSEADPVAILINTLTAFGNVIGSSPHHSVEKSEHRPNLYCVQVGKSAKGRKVRHGRRPGLCFGSLIRTGAKSESKADYPVVKA